MLKRFESRVYAAKRLAKSRVNAGENYASQFRTIVAPSGVKTDSG